MPTKASKFCYRCNRLAVSNGMCEVHRRDYVKQAAQRRDNKWLFMYNNSRWLALRQQQLRKNPLCTECFKNNRLTEATVADHIVPHNGDPDLFYDADNLQSLCASCHSVKTAREDGGFGNAKLSV